MSFTDDGHDLYARTPPLARPGIVTMPQPDTKRDEVDGVTAMQQLGAQEMKAAKRWLHHNVNQHRRELGLPVEHDLEDLALAVVAVGRAYANLTKKVITAFAPIIKELGQHRGESHILRGSE